MPTKDRYDSQKRREEYERNKAKPGWVEAERARQREYDATKRVRDPEKRREENRRAYEKAKLAPDYRAKQRAAVAKSYAKHAEKRRAEQRVARSTPEAKAKAAERARQWRKANPGDRRSAWKQRGAKGEVNREYVAVLVNDPCSYCGKPAGEIDHIVPVAAGGSSQWENLTACCSFCNRSKRDRSLLTYLLRVRSRAA